MHKIMQQVSTYNVVSNNYWALLSGTIKEDNEGTTHSSSPSAQVTEKHSQQLLLSALFGGQSAMSRVLDLGATSHFVRKEDNLPMLGPSHKQVQMPNGCIETVSHKHNYLTPHFPTKLRKRMCSQPSPIIICTFFCCLRIVSAEASIHYHKSSKVCISITQVVLLASSPSHFVQLFIE